MRRAGVDHRSDILVRYADREVAETVAVEIPGGQGVAEVIVEVAPALAQRELELAEELVAGCREAVAAAEEDLNDAGAAISGRGLVLARNPDRQVLEAVVVEVAGGEGVPEPVAVLRRFEDAGRVLIEAADRAIRSP